MVEPELNKSEADVASFVQVAEINDVPPGHMKSIILKGWPVVLANVGGEFHAFADYCYHWGLRLSDGQLNGCIVRCRGHGWLYDVSKGVVVGSGRTEDMVGNPMITFKTKIVDNIVWIASTPERH